MNSRRRVTAALIGLLVLVVGVWLARQVWSEQHDGTRPGTVDVRP